MIIACFGCELEFNRTRRKGAVGKGREQRQVRGDQREQDQRINSERGMFVAILVASDKSPG